MKISRILCVVTMLCALCECTVNDDRISALLVSPAGEQYEFYSCTQLIATMQNIKTMERQLKSQVLNAGGVASIVGGYKLDYANQHGAFIAARNVAREKKCQMPLEATVDEPL